MTSAIRRTCLSEGERNFVKILPQTGLSFHSVLFSLADALSVLKKSKNLP